MAIFATLRSTPTILLPLLALWLSMTGPAAHAHPSQAIIRQKVSALKPLQQQPQDALTQATNTISFFLQTARQLNGSGRQEHQVFAQDFFISFCSHAKLNALCSHSVHRLALFKPQQHKIIFPHHQFW